MCGVNICLNYVDSAVLLVNGYLLFFIQGDNLHRFPAHLHPKVGVRVLRGGMTPGAEKNQHGSGDGHKQGDNVKILAFHKLPMANVIKEQGYFTISWAEWEARGRGDVIKDGGVEKPLH